MTDLAHALAGGAASLACACGTKSLGLAAGYAWAGSSLRSPLTEAGVPGPLVLGSMGWGAAAALHDGGGVAVRMAGDLCPQGMNRPDSPTARAAGAQRGTN